MDRNKVAKSIKWLHRPSGFIDRILQPRLMIFIEGASLYVIALVCTIIAVCLPLMELVPFSATAAGAVLAIFGLSLISHDGFLALIAFVLTTFTFGIILYNLILT